MTLALLTLIAVVVVGMLLGLPIGFAMWMSGAAYLAVKGQDMALVIEQVGQGLFNSYVLLAVPTGVAISMTLAVWINNLRAGWLRAVFRTVYYLPMVTIGVAVALLWQVLLAPVFEALLWPIATWLLLAPQRRAPDRDENRPL